MKQRAISRSMAVFLILALLFSLTACTKTAQPSDGTQEAKGSTAQITDIQISDSGNSAVSVNSYTIETEITTNTGTSDVASTDTETTSSTTNKNTSTTTQSTAPTIPPAESAGTGQQTDPENVEDAPEPVTPPAIETPVTVGFTPISPADYYGRTWLKDQTNGTALVRAYDRIVKGVSDMEGTIALKDKDHPISKNELDVIMDCYRSDYPQHFWLGLEYSYKHSGESEILSLTPKYTLSPQEKAVAEAKFKTAAKTILNGLSGSMSQYELEKEIHDRLILACTYSNESSFCHTAYGALVENKAVCDGFSKAFQYLCRMAGIRTMLVQGESTNPSTERPEGHAWNIVSIDGQNYHIDVTWDNAGEPAKDQMHYAYFNLTTAQILEDHTITQKGYTLPKCTATAANYFVKNNAVLKTLTVDNVVNCSQRSGNTVFCKFRMETDTDLGAWLEQNSGELLTRLGLYGEVSMICTSLGKEVMITFNQV